MKTSKCTSSCIFTRKFTKKQKQAHFGKSNKSIFPNNVKPELTDIKVTYPENSNQEIEMDLGKSMANRFVLYYGAQKKNLDNYTKVKKNDKAYGKFPNRGIAKSDKEGKVRLKFRCPQVYKEAGNTVVPHVHYIVADKNNKKWIEKLEVQEVVCDITHQELKNMISKRCAIILNALPVEYYIKDRIPMSVPLPHNLDLKAKEMKDYIKSVLPHAPVINKAVQKGKLDLLDIPIVSYCYDENCGADSHLQKKLNEIGFKNVKLYSLGIQGYRKREKRSL